MLKQWIALTLCFLTTGMMIVPAAAQENVCNADLIGQADTLLTQAAPPR